MYKVLISTLFVLTSFIFSASAQNSYRLRDLADQLQRNSSNVADNTYRDFTRRYNNSSSDIDKLLNAQQIKANGEIFRRLVNDNRSNSELRDVADAMNNLARRSGGYDMGQVQNNLRDIVRELGGNSWGGGTNNHTDDHDRDVIGRLRWRGTVDDEVDIAIHRGNVEVRTISGSTYGAGAFNFTSPLPNRKVELHVDKKKGRGQVRVIQEPSRENDYTAVIQIRDKDSGAKEYDLDIYWMR